MPADDPNTPRSTTTPPHRTPHDPTISPEPTRSGGGGVWIVVVALLAVVLIAGWMFMSDDTVPATDGTPPALSDTDPVTDDPVLDDTAPADDVIILDDTVAPTE